MQKGFNDAKCKCKQNDEEKMGVNKIEALPSIEIQPLWQVA